MFLLGKDMNQHRWTCLTTLVIATVLAPIATVNAKTLAASALDSRDSRVPLSPRSLPIVTPLTVTELQTDVAVPTVTRVVPAVSQLPIVKPIESLSAAPIAVAPSTLAQHKFSLQQKFPNPQPYPAAVSTAKFVATNISFNPHLKAIAAEATPEPAIATLPQSDTSAAQVPSTTVAPKPQTFSSFTTRKLAMPISVVRQNGLQSTPIVNSATVQAEIANNNLPQPIPSVAPLTDRVAAATYHVETVPLPQPAPIIAAVEERAEFPSFEAGAPVFVFDNERPQQIVTTTIAQIGGETVAAEPSIAIPVQRPQQATIPQQQSSLPDRTSVQPDESGIVKIEQPIETVQPAIDKIIATQTGKASWYGSEGGARTANGERYNPNGLTAAHRTLPFGTKVRVTSLKTGKSAIVRINDRGPFHRSRMIDVSAGTAAAIGIKNDGIGDVKMEVLADEG